MPSERSHLHDLLRRHGLRATKGLGQHFLAEEDVLRAIAAATSAGPDADVVEVGAGIANLSMLLALTGARVTALEIDRKFEPIHQELMLGAPDLRGGQLDFVYGDALRFDFRRAEEAARAAGRRFLIAGNIPYQITSPLIMGVLDAGVAFDAMTFLMQKEVAERLTAKPGGKLNGGITIKVQHDCVVEALDEVGAEAFLPPPEVDSRVVRFRRRAGVDGAQMEAWMTARRELFRLVDAAFAQRRKMLSNSVAAVKAGWTRGEVDAALEAIGLPASARAEQLGVAEFVALLDNLNDVTSRLTKRESTDLSLDS